MKPAITIEFFGIPRERAGKSHMIVQATNVRELLLRIVKECPQLGELVDKHGQLAQQYRLSVNGERFIVDLQERLDPNEHVLLLSADAGG